MGKSKLESERNSLVLRNKTVEKRENSTHTRTLEQFPRNVKIIVVADDFRGFGVKTRYVEQRGFIMNWKRNPDRDDGKIPILELDSGEVVCDKKLWWTFVEKERLEVVE